MQEFVGKSFFVLDGNELKLLIRLFWKKLHILYTCTLIPKVVPSRIHDITEALR